ncbi:hypothetical protein PTSG_12477 [Salpingoeca rosetta]|uniref:Corrinoid adenosyltransferase MMAB n=1 Tax=Salpingoeca rosetta (strain ATCC 50818 / BSB-021) TaxID=946362 RepID=F2UEK6_SALR5|nr:uncharacterized protein PTSG_12477 [Salpingoeca rosetta]EGD75056.1 hypothetical protein PTSG_12477 [Salpingoeca rosetta]|eukprot:XP_004992109.1 hypothetical protein PTSG_12477 [Salpingoeca rosetta]
MDDGRLCGVAGLPSGRISDDLSGATAAVLCAAWQRGGTTTPCTVSKRFSSTDTLKIYTRTGDKGTSSLFTGERRSKGDAVFEALGSIDEVSSFIGLAIAKIDSDNLEDLRSQLYEMLEHTSPRLSTSATEARIERTSVPASYTEDLEGWIDAMTQTLPPLKNFILPGGTELGAALHCARTACRRAERRVVEANAHDEISETAMQLINRLSDYLFTAARHATATVGGEELVYLSATKRRERSLTRRTAQHQQQ